MMIREGVQVLDGDEQPHRHRHAGLAPPPLRQAKFKVSINTSPKTLKQQEAGSSLTTRQPANPPARQPTRQPQPAESANALSISYIQHRPFDIVPPSLVQSTTGRRCSPSIASQVTQEPRALAPLEKAAAITISIAW